MECQHTNNMETEKNISNNGGYSPEDIIWHQHSNKLLIKIMELWWDKKMPIIDLGCGHNFYMNVMNLLGYIGHGIDLIDFPGVFPLDITKPLDIRTPCNVISLEVGEHIPIELSGAYLDNVCRFNGHVILSWAVPGQAGIGHINCQPNEWVIEQMAARNYEHVQDKTNELREAVKDCHCSWFKNTLMYFKRK